MSERNKVAIKSLEEVRDEIAKELENYQFDWQRDEVNIIEEHIKIINNKINELNGKKQ